MIEYKVRPVSRYIVTRYESTDNSASLSTIGEFPNRQLARDVARAFAGNHADYSENILPEHDILAMLQNIAEEAHNAKRGIVVLIGESGDVEVFGVGQSVGDPNEILAAGAARLAEIK